MNGWQLPDCGLKYHRSMNWFPVPRFRGSEQGSPSEGRSLLYNATPNFYNYHLIKDGFISNEHLSSSKEDLPTTNELLERVFRVSLFRAHARQTLAIFMSDLSAVSTKKLSIHLFSTPKRWTTLKGLIFDYNKISPH